MLDQSSFYLDECEHCSFALIFSFSVFIVTYIVYIPCIS